MIVEGSGESVEPSPVHVSSLVSPVTNAATISSTSGGDVIERGLITVSDAEAAMWHFEKEISSNSFVWPVGLGFDVPSLRFNHPTLFVAALIAGGHGMPKFRAALEQDLKETIARRMIVDVSKDLDLLLGLLLHLLWSVDETNRFLKLSKPNRYNHYPYEDHNQLYTYVYLVVLLLNDLNVHGLAMSSSDPNEKLDMCRVYLTTYLMSTWYVDLMILKYVDSVVLALHLRSGSHGHSTTMNMSLGVLKYWHSCRMSQATRSVYRRS